MQYDVTVYTESTFTVEADSIEEAKAMAVDQAEIHSGMYYDWQVEDDDVEPVLE